MFSGGIRMDDVIERTDALWKEGSCRSRFGVEPVRLAGWLHVTGEK